jgi:Methane oxygenase PmoA
VTQPWLADWNPPRPHVHPLRTPSGRVLSTSAPADHPWHFGLWSTIKFVNGENYWETYGEFGMLSTVDVNTTDGVTAATIDWVAPGGDAIAVREVRTLAHRDLDDQSYEIEWTFALTPTVDTEFDRTPFTTWGGYGGLTLRGAADWTDTQLLLGNRDGWRDRVLGESAPWCLLASNDASVAIIDHPTNPNFPTPWYGSNRADTYGDGWANFLNAAFLWNGPLRVSAGETLRRAHLVVVSDGRLDGARVDTLATEWHAS